MKLKENRISFNKQNHSFKTQPYEAKGTGLLDLIDENVRASLIKANETARAADDLLFGSIGTFVKNQIPASDETARSQYKGEHHTVLKLPNSKFGIANYIGPGTEILKRTQAGDPPRTYTDKVAQAHDLRYALAKTDDDVSKADAIMIKKLKRGKSEKSDSMMNIEQGLKGIQLKNIAEDVGLISKKHFIKDNPTYSNEERALMSSSLNKLEQEGFGLLPGDLLKLKLLKQLKKKKISGRGVSLPGTGLNIPGTGLSLPGGGMKLIPPIRSLFKEIGSTLPPTMINKVITKAIKKSDTPKKLISRVVKVILPMTQISDEHYGYLKPLLVKDLQQIISARQAGGSFFRSFIKGFKSVFVPGAKILGSIASVVGQPEIGIPLTVLSNVLDRK